MNDVYFAKFAKGFLCQNFVLYGTVLQFNYNNILLKDELDKESILKLELGIKEEHIDELKKENQVIASHFLNQGDI